MLSGLCDILLASIMKMIIWASSSSVSTFEVEVLCSVDILGNWLWVHLQCVRVGDVACDDNVVPLVVIQRVFTVPLQQTRPIPQVEHIVDKPGMNKAGDEHIRVCLSLCVCVCSVLVIHALLYPPRLIDFMRKNLTLTWTLIIAPNNNKLLGLVVTLLVRFFITPNHQK